MAGSRYIFSIDDLEAYASNHLPKMVRDYYNGGAMDGITLRGNRDAYAQYWIRPRVLRDVSRLSTETKVFDNTIPLPLCVAPAAMQKMAHPDGEEATARACGTFGTIMGLSSFSTTSLEDNAGLEGPSECVLQLYLFENRSTSEHLIRRAEEVGYKAIVLTVDTPYFGRRLSELRNAFRPPPHLKMANFPDSLGVKTGSEHRTNGDQTWPAGGQGVTLPTGASSSNPPPNKNDPTLTWDSIAYLKSITKLPIWLKGILTEEDALLAVQHGADGIFISNHGGRQLDYAPPTLDMLPRIAKVVKRRIPIHFDGGIRRGSDLFKALCLGADVVWIGRPALWAISYDGERGLRLALRLIQQEFEACMALAGCSALEELGPQLLMPVTTTSTSKL
ncbi:peroxisomal glycolate oxidase [Thozetella sp. PMI_491]|nr:peroxisomal glycolate oxidase [Thozetella sp. PMI_491]